MQTVVVMGASIGWPQRCACCLQGPVENVPTQKTQSTYLVVATYKKTLTVQVPYCAECAPRVRARGQMTGWVKALLVFVGLWFGGTLLAALIGAAFQRAPAVGAIFLPLLSCGAPIVGTILYVRGQRAKRLPPPPPPHVCGQRPAVEIASFAKDSVTLTVHNDQYAAALQAVNAPKGPPPAPPDRFARR